MRVNAALAAPGRGFLLVWQGESGVYKKAAIK
jgi:hypothetical protein